MLLELIRAIRQVLKFEAAHTRVSILQRGSRRGLIRGKWQGSCIISSVLVAHTFSLNIGAHCSTLSRSGTTRGTLRTPSTLYLPSCQTGRHRGTTLNTICVTSIGLEVAHRELLAVLVDIADKPLVTA